MTWVHNRCPPRRRQATAEHLFSGMASSCSWFPIIPRQAASSKGDERANLNLLISVSIGGKFTQFGVCHHVQFPAPRHGGGLKHKRWVANPPSGVCSGGGNL